MTQPLFTDEEWEAADERKRKRQELLVEAEKAQVRNIADVQAREQAPQRAEALHIEKRTQVPYATVERNLDEMRARDAYQQLGPVRVANSPAWGTFLDGPVGVIALQNPENTRAIADAIDWRTVGSPQQGSFGAGFDQGLWMTQVANLAHAVKWGRASATDEVKFDRLWRNSPPVHDAPGYFDDFVRMVGSQVPVQGSIFAHGLAGGASGGTVGATAATVPALGATLTGVGAPAAPLIVKAGAVIGAAAGFKGGTAYGSYHLEGGLAYVEMLGEAERVYQETGEVIPHEAIFAASEFVGVVNGALEFISFRVMFGNPFLSGLKRKLVSKAGLDIIKSKTLRPYLMAFGKRVLVSAGTEAATEFSQEQVVMGMTQALIASTTSLEAEVPEDWFERTVKSTLAGFALGPVMTTAAAPFHAAVMRVGMNEQTLAHENRLDAITAAVAEGELSGADPAALRSWLQGMLEEGGGDPNLYVPAENLVELFQEDEALAEAMPGVLEQLAEALATGGDVVVPIADYATYLGEHHEALKGVVRHGLGERNVAEVEATEAEDEAALQAEMDALAGTEEGAAELTPGERVEQSFIEQAVRTGAMRPEDAQFVAQILRAQAETRAEGVAGERAFEQLEGMEVEGPEGPVAPPTLEEALARVDIGTLLNTLREAPEAPTPEVAQLASVLETLGFDLEQMTNEEIIGELESRFAPTTLEQPAGQSTRGVALGFRDDEIPAPGGEWAGYKRANKRLSAAGDLPAGKKQRYFQETTKKSRRGPTGRKLKKPREVTTPGAAEGTAAFVDYEADEESIYIEYAATHQDYQRQGIISDLIDELVERYPNARVRFSKVMAPTIGDIAERLKAEGRNVTYGRDFGDYEPSVKPRYEKRVGPEAPTTLEQAVGAEAEIEDALERAAPKDPKKEDERLEALVGAFPGLANVLPLLTRSERAKVKKNSADLILKVFEHYDPEELASVGFAGRAKRGWYRASAQAILDVFGLEDAPRFAALLASMSPQTSVENNLENALNTWVNWDKAGRPTGKAEILAVMGASVQGTKGADSVLDAWVNNSVRALSAETPADMELDLTISGPKVNSFMLNLSDMVNEVTLDAWMANYGLMSQALLGGTGMNVAETEPGKPAAYVAYSAAVREAARIATERTGDLWTPSEIQETVWSWAKVLYEKAGAAGEDRTARQILAAADLTAEEVADTPDFATLFAGGIYRKILAGGQLGEGIRETQEGREPAGAAPGGEGAVTQAEGAGIAQDAFDRHLFAAADRLDALRADRERDRAANQGLALSEENLRGLGLLDAQGLISLPGDGAKPVPLAQLHKGVRVPASAQRSIYRALGLTATKGQDTNESLKIYPLQTVFGETVEEVEAQLAQWLEKVGWNYRVFGPHAGENGKAFYPDFSDPETPTYENTNTVWIYDPSESEGSFMDHAYTLAWRVTHEVGHAIANEQMTEKYGARGRRAGALGIIAKGPHRKPIDPLILADGMRAVEWEHLTFIEQRRILEEDFGIAITDEEFLQENAINLVGAVQRVLTGQFGDPGNLGVEASALDSDALLASAFDLLRFASFQITGDIAQTFPEQESPVFGKKTGIELTKRHQKQRTALRKAQKATTLTQPVGAGVRGSLTYDPELNNILMRFTKSKNLSTALHESGHLFFVMLMQDAQTEGASPQLLADMQAALDYLGAESIEALTTEQHEVWARSFEAYLREGKAPSVELQAAFERFKRWLLQVYRTLRGLDVELTPEIREVFDRMLATEEQIALAGEQDRMLPAFESAEAAGMTEAEYEAYRQAHERAHIQAEQQTTKKLLAELQREKTEEWRENYEKMRAEVEAEINAQPIVQLRHWLQFGTLLNEETPEELEAVKLDRDALEAMYPEGLEGESILKVLPGSGGNSVWRNEGGVHPDELASVLGLTSGDALVRELVKSRNRNDSIEEETTRRMKETYGDILNDGTLPELAIEAMENDAKGVFLIRQGRILARRSGIAGTPQGLARLAARRSVGGKTYRQLSPHRYRLAEQRAAREVLAAVEAQDWEAAHEAGRKQLLNHFLVVEATKAKDQSEKRVAALKLFTTKAVRERIGMAGEIVVAETTGEEIAEGETYLDRIDDILDRIDLRKISAKAAARRISLSLFVAKLKERSATEAIAIPAISPDLLRSLEGEDFRKPWQDLTVTELKDVADAVKSLAHVARFKNKLLKAKDQRDFAEIRDDLLESLEKNKRTDKPLAREPRLPTERKWRGIASFLSELRKITSLLSEADNDEPGVFHDKVLFPMDAAGHWEHDELLKAGEVLSELFDRFSGNFPSRLGTTLRVSEPDVYRKQYVEALGGEFSKEGLLMMLLDLGNAGNRQRLQSGDNFTDAQIEALLNDPSVFTKEDFDWAQKVWDFVGSYWGQISDKQKRVTGVRPERVEAVPLQTRFGTYAGGYIPIAYDRMLQGPAGRGSSPDAVADTLKQMNAGNYVSAVTRHGFTEARLAEVHGMPLRLDFGVIFEHIQGVIHDLAYHEWMIDANRIFRDPSIALSIKQGYGHDAFRVIESALKTIAVGDVASSTGMNRVLNHLRRKTSVSILGSNFRTILLQYTGLLPAMEAHGAKWIAVGSRALSSGDKTYENSTMMVNRASFRTADSNRELREAQTEFRRVGVLKKSYETVGYTGIIFTQSHVDRVVWLGVYAKEMHEGSGDEVRAYAVADRAVLETQGGGQIKDLSELQTRDATTKILTAFMSYANVLQQREAQAWRRLGRRRREGGDTRKAVGDWARFLGSTQMIFFMSELITSIVIDTLLQDWDEDKEWYEYLLDNYLFNGLLSLANPIPILREVTGTLRGYQYGGPASLRVVPAFGGVMVQTKQVLDKGTEELDSALAFALLDFMGTFTGFPAPATKKLIRGAEYMKETGSWNPANLLFGPPRENR